LTSDIDTYLRDLRSALEGADPALVQDALFDAEEYLNEGLAAAGRPPDDRPGGSPGDFAAIVERYGRPQEVASAYLENAAGVVAVRAPAGSPVVGSVASTEVPGSPEISGRPIGASDRGAWRLFFGVVGDPRAYLALVYMLISLVTGVLFFTIVVTGLSMSTGLIVLVIGVPFFLGFLAVVRALSLAEGRIVEALLGTRMPRRSRSEPSATGLWGRIRFWMKDRRTWTAMFYMLLLCPLGAAYFSLSVAGLAAGLWGVVAPFVQIAVGHTYMTIDGEWYSLPVWSLPLIVIAGALFLVVMLHAIRGIGRAHGAFAKAMLVRLG